MARLNKQFVLPVFIIVTGIAWLLNARGFYPQVEWIWVCILATTGLLILAVAGLDKITFVIGPFLIITSIFSVLRQTDKITNETMVPVLVIILGVLILLTNLIKLPAPSILKTEDQQY